MDGWMERRTTQHHHRRTDRHQGYYISRLGINVLMYYFLELVYNQKIYKPNSRDIAFSKMDTKSVCLMTSCLKPYCRMAPRFSSVALEMGMH
jgi:hypothetical protein